MHGKTVIRFPRAGKSHLERERSVALAVAPALRLTTTKQPLVNTLIQSNWPPGFDDGVVLKTKLWTAKEHVALPYFCNIPGHGAVSSASPLSVLHGSIYISPGSRLEQNFSDPGDDVLLFPKKYF